MTMATTIADVAAYGFVGLATLATVCGLVSLITGFVRDQPVGLATAGLLVSIVALVLWVLMFFAIMEIKREVQGYRQNRFNQPMMR